MSPRDNYLGAAGRHLRPLLDLTVRGLELYGRGLLATERIALRTLRARLDAAAPAHQAPAPAFRDEARTNPASQLARLLDRSLTQDIDAATRESYGAILRQLVPDEARIFAALATGPPAPLVQVLRRAGGEPILENASLIGRMAAATLPTRTPIYVTHLLALGLVEIGPEDSENPEGYELLMADKDVRAALKQGEFSKLPARTTKGTLRLSRLGEELWQACQI